VDGAILAANQVQDQRISMLESGPEVKTSVYIFDLLIAFALDTSVAGAVLAGITKKLSMCLCAQVRSFQRYPN